MKKILFIYNPNAGHVQIKNHLWDILNVFAQADYQMQVMPTTKRMDACHRVQQGISDFDFIVCSGGDGTLNEVVNGMMSLTPEERRPIGYIPAGTTNDYATSLNISKNMKEAAEEIVNGKTVLLDVGRFNEKNFVYVAAFGLFTEVSYSTDQEYKNMLGHVAYVLEGIKSITNIKTYHLKVETESETYEGSYIYGMITNALSVGGIYSLDKNTVNFTDGQFEVLLVHEPKQLSDLTEINAYLLGINKECRLIDSFKANRLQITPNEEMPWALDGEDGGAPAKAEISVVQKALPLILKEEKIK